MHGTAASSEDKERDVLCYCTVSVCDRLMQNVQMQLAQLKNKIELIVPEQEVFTESLDEVTFLLCFITVYLFYAME